VLTRAHWTAPQDDGLYSMCYNEGDGFWNEQLRPDTVLRVRSMPQRSYNDAMFTFCPLGS
jgi:GH24 family phage-related lysozyme (muramidase)